MAITRRFQTGFELGMLSAECNSIGTALSAAISGLRSKTGSYSLVIGGNAGGGTYGAVAWTITATRQFRVGFHVYLGYNGGGSIVPVASWRQTDDTLMGSLRYQTNTGRFVLYDFNGVAQHTFDGIVMNQWYHIGIDVKIDAAAGWISIYVDGVEQMHCAGNTGNANLTRVVLGAAPFVAIFGAEYYYYDDVTIDDTTGEADHAVVPDRRYLWNKAMTPDGAYTDWAMSAGADHFAMVDEIPHDSDTTYNYANATGLQDSYTVADFATPASASIAAMIMTAIARKGSVADIQLKLGSSYDGHELIGAAQDLPTSYGLMLWERQVLQPDGATAWDDTAADGLEVIIESAGTYV